MSAEYQSNNDDELADVAIDMLAGFVIAGKSNVDSDTEWEDSQFFSDNIMDENQNPEEAAESGKDHLRAAAGNLKEAASARVEDIRQAAGQKADEFRAAAQGKAQELKGTAEGAWSDVRSKAKRWQADGEVYVRDNPTKAVLVALGLGLLLGLLLRK